MRPGQQIASHNERTDMEALYKVYDKSEGGIVDVMLSYDESMLYALDSNCLILAQDANVEKALALIEQIRINN